MLHIYLLWLGGWLGRQVILTGTPVQNNLHESWALLHYLVPSVFTNSGAFDDAFAFTASEAKGAKDSKDPETGGDRRVDRKRSRGSNQKEVIEINSEDEADPSSSGKSGGGGVSGSGSAALVDRSKLSAAHHVLRLFVLRRLKSEVSECGRESVSK